VTVINDFSLDEQWYLYRKARELKEALRDEQDLTPFRLRNPETAAYMIFMEDSTRTKESFRNAAEFHGMKVNMFDSKTSSFQKNETITDCIKMLCGYSTGQSVFVVRSKVEGVCRWLDESIGNFALRRGFPRPSFINAGDGRHEHPTQELLDEFSFLEHKGWDSTSIHLALIGDLFHGRTVHSKVDGLKIYERVEVDLIAPEELALPQSYEDRMVAAGFHVRKFSSIEEYLQQPKVALIWYFTRLQLERMGDKVLAGVGALRDAVTFQKKFVDKMPKGAKFFHPLPRDARFPDLPFWLDDSEFNGWDRQSQNGYFTRIVLLGMLSGQFGKDFVGQEGERTPVAALADEPDLDGEGDFGFVCRMAGGFVRQVAVSEEKRSCPRITSGITVSRIAEGQSVEAIWSRMYMVRSDLGLNSIGEMGVFNSEAVGEDGKAKRYGFISLPDFDVEQLKTKKQFKRLAAMAPNCTLSVINKGAVEVKFLLQVPPKIYNFPDISCKNEGCISNPKNMQHEVRAYFLREQSMNPQSDTSPRQSLDNWVFACKYCEKVHSYSDIWDSKYC